MLFKMKKHRPIYRGIIMKISQMEEIPNETINMDCEAGSEKIVFLKKDPVYNAYYDIFTNQPYYEINDMCLSVGDYALVYLSKGRNYLNYLSLNQLKNYCYNLNKELEESKNDSNISEEIYKKLIKKQV